MSIGARVAGEYPLFNSYHRGALAAEAQVLVTSAQEYVLEETKMGSLDAPNVAVVDRRVWIERNVAFFDVLMSESLGAPPNRPWGQPIIAAETGALLGVLARRVLGQYELVMPSESAGDTIYLVGPNILSMERANQFRPSEFRMWIALHECTHRLQFMSVPWMRDYFFGLVKTLSSNAKPQEGRIAHVANQLREAAVSGEPLIDESGVLGLLATDEQKEELDRVQALMALLEGHGHVVMDRIGERILKSQPRMSKLVKARRSDPRMAAFMRITGMEMKMRQYELGEKFVLGVEDIAGHDALAVAWSEPAALPTLAEIEDPEAWLRRVN